MDPETTAVDNGTEDQTTADAADREVADREAALEIAERRGWVGQLDQYRDTRTEGALLALAEVRVAEVALPERHTLDRYERRRLTLDVLEALDRAAEHYARLELWTDPASSDDFIAVGLRAPAPLDLDSPLLRSLRPSEQVEYKGVQVFLLGGTVENFEAVARVAMKRLHRHYQRQMLAAAQQLSGANETIEADLLAYLKGEARVPNYSAMVGFPASLTVTPR